MKITKDAPVAYFCAEYGLQANLPLYAGGLGVLAGDTVKESGDQNFPMIALGILYRGCDTIQKVDETGWQTEEDCYVDPVAAGFEHVYLPDSEQPLFVRIHLTQNEVWARVWKQTVNQTTLYLLDTDTDQNEAEERGITCAVYSGGDDFLLKQQLILGIGGIKVLKKLGITPALYHINEGRPAFLYWQLIRQLMDSGDYDFASASEKAKSMIVYTNHTLVRAGNNAYDLQPLKNYAQYYADKMGVSIDELLAPGIDPVTNSFSMTQFALNVSKKASAVSKTHLDLSKSIWPEYTWVGITNGIHLPTWQDKEIATLDTHTDDLWYTHLKKKQELVDFVASRTGYGYDPNRLVIAWARRIASYKRPYSLFEDLERLEKIVKSQDRPVQILVSGRAHSSDQSAKKILQSIIQAMQNQLAGHAIYIPNYDIDVAQMMVKGVDLWVNTPISGQEASGTSGMKAASNGVLQLTVEDGWSAEVDWHDVGWTIDSNHLKETLYFRLEDDIIPAYYRRNDRGIPESWLARMKRTLALAEYFNTARMLREYQELLYSPL